MELREIKHSLFLLELIRPSGEIRSNNKTSSLFRYKVFCFTAQSGAKPPIKVSEVSSPNNIFISVKNVDKVKI